MNKTEKITASETKRLLDHAAVQPKMNGARVAEFLNVEASRVSEGRHEGWRLTRVQADKLVEEFGLPRKKPGQYLLAETRDSIELLINSEPDTSKVRHLNRMISASKSVEKRNKLADEIELFDADGRAINFYNTFRSLDVETSDGDKADKLREQKFTEYLLESRPEKLEKLDALITDPALDLWLTCAKHAFASFAHDEDNSSEKKLKRLSGHLLDTHCSPEGQFAPEECEHAAYPSLDTLGKQHGLKLPQRGAVMPIFYLALLHRAQKPKLFDLESPLTSLQEYVITGDVIWSEEIGFNQPKVGQSYFDEACPALSAEKPHWRPPFNGDKLVDDYIWDQSDVSLDKWTTCSVAVYLSENCEYSVALSLGSFDCGESSQVIHVPERFIVIPRIETKRLFTELEALRKWLTLPELPEADIKTEIAKHGGYIPGATVI